MFEVGQKVKVTDQLPHAIGIVEEVSTWKKRNGISGGRCYRIRSDDWARPNWIDEGFVGKVDES